MLGGKGGQAPGSHAYQCQYICTDGYAQYAVVPHYYFAYSNYPYYYSTYYNNYYFNSGPAIRFEGMKNSVLPVLNADGINHFPELKSIYKLIYYYGIIEYVDVYGVISYKTENSLWFEENKQSFETVENAYKKVGSELSEIVNTLRLYEKQPYWYKNMMQKMLYRYGKIVQDAYTGKEGMDTWIRFANSLKLRMAMRIVKVEPQLAKQWAEEAVAGGVIESYEQQVGLTPMNEGFSNPLLDITKTWNDSRLCASFESLLMSLDHPYTKYMFNKNSEVLKNNKTGEVTPANTRIVGLRAGGHFGEDQSYAGNQYVGVSQVNPENIAMVPLWLIKCAEVDFLRAEGALRGWDMGGDAQFFYERGIRNASLVDPLLFDYDYADLVEAYLQKETATDYTYVDPFGDTPDMPSVTKIGVKWNEGDDRETKLEKIITQKYIALYPNSYEAWAELRRTGYPRLFPVLNPQEGDGSLNDGDMIRRIQYPFDYYFSSDGNFVLPIASALGGPNQQATRLWWDVDCDNFNTSVSNVSVPSLHPSYYTLDGRRTNMPQHGINIARDADGKVRKMVVR